MLHVRTFGSVDISNERGALHGILTQPKRTALLVYLAVASPGDLHRRDSLLALFWPHLDERRARNALSQALTFLRRELGEGVLVTRGLEEVGVDRARVRTDADAFESAIAGAQWAEAVAVYRGEFLHGLHVSESEFDSWLDVRRHRFRDMAAAACWTLAHAAIQRETSEAEHYARQAFQLDGGGEARVRSFLEALISAGERAAAVRFYHEWARCMVGQLDLSPSLETQQLIASLRLEGTKESVAVWASSPSRAPPGAIVHPAISRVEAVARRPATRLRLHMAVAALVLSAAYGVVVLAGGPSAVGASADTTPATTNVAAAAEVSPHRIAVFPFEQRGSTDMPHLPESVMDLVSEALDGVGDLRRVDPRSVMSRLRLVGLDDSGQTDPRRAADIALHFGAARHVLGTVTILNDTVRISAGVYDALAEGNPLAQTSSTGALTDLPRVVHELVRGLLGALELGEGIRAVSMSGIDSTSYEAWKAYLQGEVLLRRGRFAEAGRTFGRSVAADSTLAAAWLRLWFVQGWGAAGDPLYSIRRAIDFRDRLSARDAMLADATLAFATGDGIRAEEAARNVIGRYPDHVDGWYIFAAAHAIYAWQLGRPSAELRQITDRLLALDPDHPAGLTYALFVAVTDRRFSDARHLLQRMRDTSVWRVANELAIANAVGDESVRSHYLHRMRLMPEPAILTISHQLVLSDDLDLPAALLADLRDAPHRSRWARAVGGFHGGNLEVSRGRWAAADSLYAQADTLTPESLPTRAVIAALPLFRRSDEELSRLVQALERSAPGSSWLTPAGATRAPPPLAPWLNDYALGILSARLNDSAAAMRYGQRLATAQSPPDPAGLRADLAREIHALFALRNARPDEALSILGSNPGGGVLWNDFGFPLYQRPLGRFLRAEALYQLGRYEEAFPWYEGMTRSLISWNYVFIGPAYLRMAEIFEATGDFQAAAEYYGRLSQRWRLADAEYRPLVAFAARRAAELRVRAKGASTPRFD